MSVCKLWTAKPSGVRLLAALARAAGEVRAGATGEEAFDHNIGHSRVPLRSRCIGADVVVTLWS